MSDKKTMRYRCNCGGRLMVKETRATNDAIYRTRKCEECKYLFTTKEEAIDEPIPREALALSDKRIKA